MSAHSVHPFLVRLVVLGALGENPSSTLPRRKLDQKPGNRKYEDQSVPVPKPRNTSRT
jgi:hypothetical protein